MNDKIVMAAPNLIGIESWLDEFLGSQTEQQSDIKKAVAINSNINAWNGLKDEFGTLAQNPCSPADSPNILSGVRAFNAP